MGYDDKEVITSGSKEDMQKFTEKRNGLGGREVKVILFNDNSSDWIYPQCFHSQQGGHFFINMYGEHAYICANCKGTHKAFNHKCSTFIEYKKSCGINNNKSSSYSETVNKRPTDLNNRYSQDNKMYDHNPNPNEDICLGYRISQASPNKHLHQTVIHKVKKAKKITAKSLNYLLNLEPAWIIGDFNDNEGNWTNHILKKKMILEIPAAPTFLTTKTIACSTKQSNNGKQLRTTDLVIGIQRPRIKREGEVVVKKQCKELESCSKQNSRLDHRNGGRPRRKQ
ncbi:hypothetical protein GJ496_008970 [Pomphorhynchus laevis]|nr:hypothetical protein GJ496_008970 [Pomphorhynchus laevis]